MPDWISPVGLLVRGPDKWASDGGAWHAKRSRDGRPRFHEGIDLVCAPGTPVVAPVPCKFVRYVDPYPDSKDGTLFGGLLRTADGWECKILYCMPHMGITPGTMLKRGEPWATSQTLQHLYPGIKDHIHVEIWSPAGQRVDPTPWFIDAPRPPSVVTA